MPILRPSDSEKNLQQAFSGLTSGPGDSHSQGSLRNFAMEYFWKDAQRDFLLGKTVECRSPKGGGGEIFIIVHISPIQKNNHIIGVTPLLPLIRFPYWAPALAPLSSNCLSRLGNLAFFSPLPVFSCQVSITIPAKPPEES